MDFNGSRLAPSIGIVLLSLLGAAPLRAQQLAWQAPAQNSQAVNVSADGSVYVSDSSGTLRSYATDGKVRWTSPLGSGIVGGLVPTGSDGFVVATSDNRLVSVSSAGQKRWEAPLPDVPTGAPAVGPDGAIYVAAGTTLLAYDSSGNKKWSFDDQSPFTASPAAGSKGVAVGVKEGGAYFVDLSGKEIFQYNVEGDVPERFSLTADGLVNYMSTDGEVIGLSDQGDKAWWADPPDSDQRFGLGQEASLNGTFYAVFGSTQIEEIKPDGSAGWTFDAGAAITAPLYLTPDNRLIVGTGDNRILTLNLQGEKQSETKISSPPSGVAADAAGHYYALIGSGSTTGGGGGAGLLAAFAPATTTPPIWAASGLSGATLLDLTPDGKDAHTFYASGDQSVAVSTDDGKTWQQHSVDVPEGGATVNDLAPASDGSIYAATQLFLFESAAGGAEFGIMARMEDVGPVASDPKNPQHVIFGNATSDRYYDSTDQGQTLNDLEAPGTLTSLYWSPDGTLYGTTNDGLYEMPAGGSWTKAADGFFTSVASTADGKTVYAGTDKGALVSSDSGKTFKTVGDTQLVGTVWRVAVNPTNGGEAMVGTVLPADNLANGSIQGVNLYHTGDGGQTWTVEDRGLSSVNPHALAAGNGFFLLASNDGVWRIDATGGSSGGDGGTVLAGDLNGDGKVNVQDATLALRIAVGLTSPTADQLKAGDVAPAGAPDGKINVTDATLILRAAVGLTHL